MSRQQDRPKYTPTQEEIAEVCRQIRSEWTAQDHEKRRVGDPVAYETPQCRVMECQ